MTREDGIVPASRPSEPNTAPPTDGGLRHVMLVGGTLADWRDLGADRWRERIQALGEAAAAEGASWLTLRPYAAGSEAVATRRHEHTVVSEGRRCTVIVEPTADGRTRFATAMADLDPGVPVSEDSVSAVLYAPAEAEPDLVVVLGPEDRLPPSLVWELAYAELVFVDTTWDELDVKHVHVAAAEFASRHRRFGGIET
jgi:undecaprenyl diphosphate synthase